MTPTEPTDWIRIRREGGENDPHAQVVVEVQFRGEDEFTELGREHIGGNFCHHWNLEAYRKHLKPVQEPAQCGGEWGMKFWVGWYSGYYADEGCTKPPFEVWVTGYRPRPKGERDDCTICAVIEAEDEVSVWEIVSQYFTDFLERFCEPKPDDWEPPLPRFPR